MIYGASFDSVEENKAFADKFSFPFELLCDSDRQIGIAYGACEDAAAGYPKRISYLIGPDGRIVRAYEQVAPATHPAQVLEDLAE